MRIKTRKLQKILAFVSVLFFAQLSSSVTLASQSDFDESQACSSYMIVEDIIELNEAIDCFNGQTSGTYTIQLRNEIKLQTQILGVVLPLPTTPINNSTAAELTIFGAGSYAINGLDLLRPLTITEGNVTVLGVRIVNGFSETTGGGIFISPQANVTLKDSYVLNNNAQWGGGIYN